MVVSMVIGLWVLSAIPAPLITHQASLISGDIGLVTQLVDLGADINQTNEKGITMILGRQTSDTRKLETDLTDTGNFKYGNSYCSPEYSSGPCSVYHACLIETDSVDRSATKSRKK